MKQILSYSGTIFVNTISVIGAMPTVLKFLDERGWGDILGKYPETTYNWLLTYIGEERFPWVAGILFGFIVGYWAGVLLANWRSKMDSKKRGQEQLHYLMIKAVNDISTLTNNFRGISSANLKIVPVDLKSDIDYLLKQLKKNKIDTPEFPSLSDLNMLEPMHRYLRTLLPYIANDELKEVRKQAKVWVSNPFSR